MSQEIADALNQAADFMNAHSWCQDAFYREYFEGDKRKERTAYCASTALKVGSSPKDRFEGVIYWNPRHYSEPEPLLTQMVIDVVLAEIQRKHPSLQTLSDLGTTGDWNLICCWNNMAGQTKKKIVLTFRRLARAQIIK